MRRVSREECRFFRKGDEKGTKSSFFRGEIPPAAWYDIGIRETVSLSEPFAYGVRSLIEGLLLLWFFAFYKELRVALDRGLSYRRFEFKSLMQILLFLAGAPKKDEGLRSLHPS